MEKAGTVSVSAAVLRVGVNDLVDRFAGRIEQSADRIVEQANTAAVQQRALALKVNAIPMVYTAGYRADPLSAAIDVWVLAFQFRETFTGAPSKTKRLSSRPVHRSSVCRVSDRSAKARRGCRRPWPDAGQSCPSEKRCGFSRSHWMCGWRASSQLRR